MRKAKPVSIPLANHFKLFLEQCLETNREIEGMTKVPYASVIGCLMYVMVCTRPDLAHVVSKICKCMSKPGRHHWEAIKWIFRYLKGGEPMCWKSTVQSIVALSTTEAEYMAVAEDAKEALWLNKLAKELGVEQGGVQLHCDSQSAIYLAKNHVYHARTKHIDKSMVTQPILVCEKLYGWSPKGLDIRQCGDLLGMAHISEIGTRWYPLVKVLREAEGKEERTERVQKVSEGLVLMDDPLVVILRVLDQNLAMATSAGVQLLGSRASPFSNRVQLALKLKFVEYEFGKKFYTSTKANVFLKPIRCTRKSRF
ncbi:UNVERIFIED_CONTAM: Retrovirus-related Pol polyprotein from transposon TNT 1-94 [Sesamum calycinum]|uniref:Retrovirus-related Pol polyprotein from transposon TNT 1-94 n=1 Tax=Sesamum calycinum TaxID=2727403 RepID=A0AAW2PTV9_9LAMI